MKISFLASGLLVIFLTTSCSEEYEHSKECIYTAAVYPNRSDFYYRVKLTKHGKSYNVNFSLNTKYDERIAQSQNAIISSHMAMRFCDEQQRMFEIRPPTSGPIKLFVDGPDGKIDMQYRNMKFNRSSSDNGQGFYIANSLSLLYTFIKKIKFSNIPEEGNWTPRKTRGA